MNQKKNTQMIAIVITGVAVLLIGAIVAYLYFETDMLKSNKKIFFKYITQMSDNKKGFINNEVKQYFEKQKNTPYETNGTIRFNISSAEQEEKIDYTNNCNIEISGKVDKLNSKSEQNISVNYAEDVKLPFIYKNVEDIIGIKSRYLGSKFIAANVNDLNKLSRTFDSETTDSIVGVLFNKESTDIQEDTKEHIKDTYIDILNKQLNKENFTKIIEDGTKGYRLTLTGEEIKNISEQILVNLEDDSTTLNLINQYLQVVGLSEIQSSDIENQITSIKNDSELNNKKLDITIYVENNLLNKITIEIDGNKLTAEKKETANTKQYNFIINSQQDGSNMNIFLNTSFSGLQSLQSITESWELGFSINNEMQYEYYFDNTVDFNSDISIEDFTDDNAVVLTSLPSEQRETLLNAVIERLTLVNSKQMESLGLTEGENPLIYALPLYYMMNLQSSELEDSDIGNIDEDAIQEHNTLFENYEDLNTQGVTVKGLLSTIQNSNENNQFNRYLQITEINFNGEEYDTTDENITLIKSEISTEETYKVEFERNPNTGIINRAVINQN